MAVKSVLSLLLWGLTVCVPGGASFCNVTCSTDYNVTLNCSCPASVPTYPVLIQVNCSDNGFEASGSCEVKPPHSWCVMYPENLEEVASVGAMCTASAVQSGAQVLGSVSELSVWELSKVVKLDPPFNVHVTNSDGFYNITWEHANQVDCLTYRVRVRESRDRSKDVILVSAVKEKHLLLQHKMLRPHVNCTVEVGVKMCPQNLYQGPWSEWSSSAEWRTAESSEELRGIFKWWYSSLSIIVLLVLCALYSKRTFFKEKLELITFIPAPDEFFKPLYINYGGNFQDWVEPVFRECDYLNMGSTVHLKSDVLQLKDEKQSYIEDEDMEEGDPLFHMQPPHSNEPLLFQHSGSSAGTGRSTGIISIHTVTLSGEEEENVSRISVNTLQSYQNGQSFGLFEDSRGHADYALEGPRTLGLESQMGLLTEQENQLSLDLSLGSINFPAHVQMNEQERVSLDSFASNEHSEDGYPHVDLDTIDSGFGECSSPGALDSHVAQQMDLFHDHKNSNYVKQWMVCGTVEEDSRNTENELDETKVIDEL